MMANDRALVGAEPFTVRGISTPVKIRPSTMTDFPELTHKLPAIDRPYLYTLAELAAQPTSPRVADEAELSLTPAQLAQKLRVERVREAKLGAIVFPQVSSALDGWTIEKMPPEEVCAELWANLYGDYSVRTAPTLFARVSGESSAASRSLAQAIADAVPGYRVRLGRWAYAQPDFAARLLEGILAS